MRRRLPDARLRPLPRLAAWALCVLFSAFCLSRAAGGLRPLLAGARSYCDIGTVAEGEGLRHAAHLPETDVANRMPLGPLLESALFAHGGPAAAPWGLTACVLASLLLTAALALFLAPPAAALLAPAAWLPLLAGLPAAPGYYRRLFYTPFVLAACAALVLRARKGGLAASAALAAAVGAGLLLRSPLAFFPLLLVAYEAASGDRPPGPWRRGALALLLLPAVFLAPWTAMNALTGRGFVLLEGKAIEKDLVPGVQGAVIGGGGYAALLPSGRPGGAGAWAAREVARHPLRYLRGFAARLRFALGLEPWLFLVALVTLAFFRGRREFRHLALFAAYFTLVHCSIATSSYYFEPLWPILTALAAALAGKAVGEPSPKAAAWAERASAAGAILSCALALWAGASLLAYAARARLTPPASEAALAGALERDPGEPWLLYQRGVRALRSGRGAAALPDLSRADDALPGVPRVELALARARAAAAPGSGWTFPLPPAAPGAFNDKTAVDARLFASLARLGHDEAGARRLLGEAREAWAQDNRLLRAESAPEQRIADAMRAGALRGFIRHYDYFLEREAPASRLPALRLYASLEDSGAEAWLRLADASLRAGDSPAARAAFASAEKAAIPDESLRGAEALCARLRAAADCASLRGRLEAAGLAGPEAEEAGELGWRDELDLAEDSLRAGLREKAAAAVADIRTPETPERRRRLASVLRGLGEHARALALLEPLAAAAPRDAELWLDVGECSLRAGRKAAASRALIRAAALGARDRSRLAGLLREAGEPRAAMRELDALLTREPRPGLWLEKARASLDAGDRAAASRALARAEALAPSPEELHRAALLYQEAGLCQRAVLILTRLAEGPRAAVALKDRAVCEFKLGRIEKARQSLEAALALDPGLEDAARSLVVVRAARKMVR